ncbi:hypothetical protein CYMTET_9534 [Cymbomonas tetramitiformis]|uniref:Uncharacterized protein n=1 Tax=Cymbomonas tetramitiformis TaxID=36881 RepID=A0AAE0LFD2_9CHLO|nr:hypothetical protein CYMTET_9534 [Cymbomonas tetramitiformis]|eukprot:gene15515-18385_t
MRLRNTPRGSAWSERFIVACVSLALLDVGLHFHQHYHEQYRRIVRKQSEAQRLHEAVCEDGTGDTKGWSLEFVDCERITQVSEDQSRALPAVMGAIERTTDDIVLLARLISRGALRDFCDNALIVFVTGLLGGVGAFVFTRTQRALTHEPLYPTLPAYSLASVPTPLIDSAGRDVSYRDAR